MFWTYLVAALVGVVSCGSCGVSGLALQHCLFRPSSVMACCVCLFVSFRYILLVGLCVVGSISHWPITMPLRFPPMVVCGCVSLVCTVFSTVVGLAVGQSFMGISVYLSNHTCMVQCLYLLSVVGSHQFLAGLGSCLVVGVASLCVVGVVSSCVRCGYWYWIGLLGVGCWLYGLGLFLVGCGFGIGTCFAMALLCLQ